MKTATVPCRGPLSHFLSLFRALVCAWSLLGTGSATAESVDSEILLLVDVSKGGLKKGEFTSLMDGYATALTSGAVIEAISGGKIAVSLSFFGVKDSDDFVGVGWMSIGGIEDANEFATKLRGLSQPTGGNYSYQDALARGVSGMVNDEGNGGNRFQSAVQIIQVAGSTKPKGKAGDVADASSSAFAQGVDMITSTVVGKKADQLESFYAENVIGGSVGEFAASVSNSPINGGLTSILTSQISDSVAAGSISAIPEPSAAMLLCSSMGVFLLFVRRRDS